MSEQKLSLAATTELVGSVVLNALDSATAAQLRADPKNTIYTKANIEIADSLAVHVVQNTNNDVALILPYYESLEMVSADPISDSDIEGVAGGEILISIIAAMVAGGVIGAVSAGVTGGTVGIAVGAAVGAVVATGVAASVVTGAVVGTRGTNK